MQNMSPKVDATTLAPAVYPEDGQLEWCPPGHGDIYPSLLGSGMLDKLIESGIKYLFVSNRFVISPACAFLQPHGCGCGPNTRRDAIGGARLLALLVLG